jgi:hypothetical protein
LFGSCIIHILNTGVLKLKKKSGAKEWMIVPDGSGQHDDDDDYRSLKTGPPRCNGYINCTTVET